ncbi:MAG TPA: AcvB/VirJ family lysyl-phosphatidylglycerol hydrolase [Gemmatimonadaceae bacterium]|nr:AcvB/VirJ family lysyl-phosphatidylglycerol hydrolase [Gemmatimonadaceae bacterium]
MTARPIPDAGRRARWPPLTVRAIVTRAVATFLLLAAASATALGAQSSASADSSVRGLPLTVVPAAHPGTTLAILLTGDGGWAPLDREVAGVLSAAGVGVVGLDVRAYLRGHPRTPEGTAADVARLARGYGARWHTTRLVLIGYSRGADMLPFVATRLAADVRERVALLALLGLASRASFEFHWVDMVRDEPRASDLLVAPELARLRGMRMLCVYGTDEADSGCRDADPTLMAKAARRGGHHFDGDYEALARLVLDALARAP